jgi:hypothetical protein
VTKWNTAKYQLGDSTPDLLSTCPSGYTPINMKPGTTSSIEASVLTQTLVQKVWPNISGDDADIYTCPEGLKWIQYSQISSCIGNNARNPRFAKVNGLVTFVCKSQARARNITMATDVVYNKVC